MVYQKVLYLTEEDRKYLEGLKDKEKKNLLSNAL